MDTMKLGNLDIKLPLAARTLCEDAIILADELRGTLSDQDFQDFRREFIINYMRMSQEVAAKGELEQKFDPYQLSTITEDLLEGDTAIEPLYSKYSESSDFLDTLKNATKEEDERQFAALLLFYIEVIQNTETTMLGSNEFDYAALMSAIAPYISALHKLILVQNSMPAQAEVLATNIKRKRGARKGGAAKAKRLDDLRELVLLEANTLHQESPATSAADAIYEKLKERGDWLDDTKGNPILKDPNTRFTAWIRADRKKNLH